jgi:hypothetical protein
MILADFGAGYSFQQMDINDENIDATAKNALETSVSAKYFFTRQAFVTLRAGYYIQNSEFRPRENVMVLVDGLPVEGETITKMKMRFNSAYISPGIGIMPVERLSLSVGLGMNFNNESWYESKEVLVKPDKGTFENGSRVRNEQEGSIDEMKSNYLSVWAGAEYDFPLNRRETVHLMPALLYDFSSGSISEEEWKYQKLIVTLGVKINISKLFE